MCIFDTISLMFKYSSSYKNRAFFLSLLIYTVLFTVFIYASVTKQEQKALIKEERISFKVCQCAPMEQKEVEKKPVEKIEKVVEKVKEKPVQKVQKVEKKIEKKKIEKKTLKKKILKKIEKPKEIVKETIKSEVEEKKPLEEIKEKLKEREVEKPIEVAKSFAASTEPSVSKELLDSISKALQENIYYPKSARRMGIQGTVHLLFKLEPSGDLTNIDIRGDVPSILERAAKKTLNKAKKDFDKVKKAVTIRVPLKFILEN